MVAPGPHRMPGADPLGDALRDDAQRLPATPTRDLVAPVMATIAARATRVEPTTRAAPARSPAGPVRSWRRFALPLAAAAALMAALRLGNDGGPTAPPAPTSPTARLAPPATASPTPGAWVAVTPPPRMPRGPAVDAPPGGPGGGLPLQLLRNSGRLPALATVDAAVRHELRDVAALAAGEAGDLARRLFAKAVGPLARLGGALSVPR